jgi:hypothetical protein
VNQLGRTRYRVGNGLITGQVDNGSDLPLLGWVCFERRGAPGRLAGPCRGSRWVGWAASWAVRERGGRPARPFGSELGHARKRKSGEGWAGWALV